MLGVKTENLKSSGESMGDSINACQGKDSDSVNQRSANLQGAGGGANG